MEFQDVMGRLGMVHNMVQDGKALRTENGICRTVIKELWADMHSVKLETILAITKAWQYEAEFDSIMEEWNRLHVYEASSSHRGRLKRPCTYLNGSPMHIKLHMKASTGSVVIVSVRPSHVFVRPCQLDRPLVRPTSIRVTTR